MKRERLSTLAERDILIGLITSDVFCDNIVPVLKPRLLEIEYARIVANWIVEFHNEFKKAPKGDILRLYRSRCEEIKDEDLRYNILTFIEKVCEENNVQAFNEDFAITQAVQYLKSRSLRELTDNIDSYLTVGEIDRAEKEITNYRKVEKGGDETISILHHTVNIIDNLTSENDTLFQFPGAYGKIMGRIHREDFISFLAPMKRGKTWALIDCGVEALRNGLNVLHISLEMSERQMVKRYWTVLTGELEEANEEIQYSYFKRSDDEEKPWRIAHKTISRNAISISNIEKKQKNIQRIARGGDIRILAVPAYSLSVEDLENKIEKLLQEDNFVPDVVIVDYADIMVPSGGSDYRNQIDTIWKKLRGLAQSRKVVVFTASQSGRQSLGKDAESIDIAEDIRKLAHITSMVALNQTSEERKKGILRLKQLAIREGEQEFREAICTQCLSIGRIVTDSRFDDEVELDSEENTQASKKRKEKKNRL